MNNTVHALLILALIMVSQVGFAQSDTLKVKHPMLSHQNDNVWGKINRATFKPIPQKVYQSYTLSETELYSWSGDNWSSNGKVNYQYQDDLLTSITGSVYDGEVYTASDRTSFSYLDGYLVQEIYEELNMGTNQLENVERTAYGYEDNSGGKALIAILYSEWENGWLVYGKDEFTYTNGVISGGTYFLTDNFNFIEDEKFLVTSENDTTTITYSQKIGTEWVLTYRERYPGFSPQELFNYFTNLDLSFYDLIFSYPLLSLQLPDVMIQQFVEGNWQNIERINSERFYDLFSGEMVRLHKNIDYWNGLEWITEQRVEGHFGTDARIDSAFIKYNFDPPSLQTYMKESYLHDSFGNLVVITSEVDLGNGLEEYTKTEIRWVAGVPTSNDDVSVISKHFQLAPAYPNPFNPSTNIQYSLEQAGDVSIRVYDMLGREVATLINGPQTSGSHTLRFEARNLSSGIYFVSMVSGEYMETKSITLLK